jgi:hypothetical protein
MRMELLLKSSQKVILLDNEYENTFLNVRTLKIEYIVSRALPCGWQ